MPANVRGRLPGCTDLPPNIAAYHPVPDRAAISFTEQLSDRPHLGSDGRANPDPDGRSDCAAHWQAHGWPDTASSNRSAVAYAVSDTNCCTINIDRDFNVHLHSRSLPRRARLRKAVC